MPYLDLCKEYKSSRDQYFKLHDDASGFAGALFTGFKEFLDLKNDDHDLIKIIPNIPDYKEDSIYTPHGAVKLDESGYWQFSILLRLHIDGNKNVHPAEIVKFNISYKNVDGAISYKFAEDLKDYNVKSDDLDKHIKETCFPEMEQTVLKFYKNRVNVFFENRTINRKIGLVP